MNINGAAKTQAVTLLPLSSFLDNKKLLQFKCAIKASV